MKKQEIADAVGVTQKTVDNKIKDLEKVEKFPNLLKLSINYQNFCLELLNVLGGGVV